MRFSVFFLIFFLISSVIADEVNIRNFCSQKLGRSYTQLHNLSDEALLSRSIEILQINGVKNYQDVIDTYEVLRSLDNIEGADEWLRVLATRDEIQVGQLISEAKIAVLESKKIGGDYIVKLANDGKLLRTDGSVAKDFDIYIEDLSGVVIRKIEVKNPLGDLPHPTLKNMKSFDGLLSHGIQKGTEHIELGLHGSREMAFIYDSSRILKLSEDPLTAGKLIQTVSKKGKTTSFAIREDGVLITFMETADGLIPNPHAPQSDIFNLISGKMMSNTTLTTPINGQLPLEKIQFYTSEGTLLKEIKINLSDVGVIITP